MRAKKQQLSTFSEASIMVGAHVADVMFTNVWWHKLPAMQQLQPAPALYQKALLIWEKYTAVKNVTYRTSATGRVNKIDYKILQTASDEITQSSQFQFPDEDNLFLQKRHKNCEKLLAAQ